MRRLDKIPNEADVLAENDTLKARVADLEAKLNQQSPTGNTCVTPEQRSVSGSASQRRTLTDRCREAKAHPRKQATSYTGVTARCLAAKNQTAKDTENQN